MLVPVKQGQYTLGRLLASVTLFCLAFGLMSLAFWISPDRSSFTFFALTALSLLCVLIGVALLFPRLAEWCWDILMLFWPWI